MRDAQLLQDAIQYLIRYGEEANLDLFERYPVCARHLATLLGGVR